MIIERAVVTGGAGFIGANLVDRLIDDGVEVLVIDDLSSGKLERLKESRRSGGLQIHQMDIRSPDVAGLLTRFSPDAVFHLAAQIDVRRSVREPAHDASVNVAGTVNMLAAAVAAGAGQFVHASSGGAIFGEASSVPTKERAAKAPMSPYGVSKLVAEQYLRYFRETAGLNYAALGFANVYGPRQDPAGEAGVVAIFTGAMLDRRRPVIFGDGKQVRDYVFVEDVTDACVRAAGFRGGRYFNIGTGVGTSVSELLDMIGELVGRKPRPKFEEAKAGDIQTSILDPSAAARALGWQPWTPLADGLAATVEWFRARG